MADLSRLDSFLSGSTAPVSPTSSNSRLDDFLKGPSEPPEPKNYTGELNDGFFSWKGNLAGRMMSAFGQGAEHGWGGTYDVGEWAAKGMKDWAESQNETAKSLNEAFVRPAIILATGLAEPVVAAISGIAGATTQFAKELEQTAKEREEYDKTHFNIPSLTGVVAGGLSEMTGAIGEGQYVAGGGIQGMTTGIPTATAGRTAAALTRGLVEIPKEPKMGSFAIPKRPERTFQDLPEPVIESRAIGAIGESEGTFMGSVAPTEAEALGRAQATAELRGPAEVRPVEDLARQLHPDAFYDYEIARNKNDILLKSLNDLRAERDRPYIEAIEKQSQKVIGKGGNLNPTEQRRLEVLQDELDNLPDTPEMVRVKELHRDNYHEMADHAQNTRAALNEANERLTGRRSDTSFADLEEPFVEAPESPPEAPTSQGPRSALTIPDEHEAHVRSLETEAMARAAAKAAAPKVNPIFADVSQKLQKLGRPKEEAEAGARIVQAHYESMAQRFKGKLGTAEELYAKEQEVITEGKEGKPRGKTFNQDEIDNIVDLSEIRFKKALEKGVKESIEGLTEPTPEERIAYISKGTKDVVAMAESQGLTGIVAKWKRVSEIVEEAGVRTFDDPEWNRIYQTALDEAKEAIRIYNENIKKPGENVVPLKKPTTLEQGTKGNISIAPDGKKIIRLFKTADASTFMHELGHSWLEQLERFSQHPEAPEDLLADWKAVQEWLGIKPGKKITRGQHEQFARGFERYLMEGTAPSEELAGVFQQFKKWLTDIYKSVIGLNVPVNDSIRGVFDRLLYTKHEPIITPTEVPRKVDLPEPVARGPEVDTVTPTSEIEVKSSTYLQEDGSFKLENIQSYADLVAAIRQGSEEAKDMALYAKQGKISNQDIIEIADSAGLNTRKINVNKLARLTIEDGIPLAARVWGLNNYLKQNAARIRQLVSHENPSPEDVLKFIEAVTLHRKVSETLLGIRGEWGRTGQILRKMLEEASTEGGLHDVVHSNMGVTYEQIVQTMKNMSATAKTTKQVSAAANKLTERSWGQWMLQVLINGYISGPITHAVYSLGNKMTILNETLVRAPGMATVGSLKQMLRGGTAAERVTWGEVYDGMYGMMYGSRDAMRAMKAAGKMGFQQGLLADDLVRARVLFENKNGKLGTADMAKREAELTKKVEEFRSKYEVEDIAKDAERVLRGKPTKIPQHLEEIFHIVAKAEPPQSHFTQSTAQRIQQRVGAKGVVEHLINAPGERLVAPIHSIDYTLAYVIHQRRLISRAARLEGERSGWTQKQVAQKMAELENDTPLDIIKEARDEALTNTVLSKSGSFTGKLKGVLSHDFHPWLPGLGKTPYLSFVQPFVGIVTEVWKKGLAPFKYSNPAMVLFSKQLRHDLSGKNGSLAQDMAIAKMSIGTTAFAAIWSYYDSGGGNGPPVHDVNESIINEMSDGIPYGIKINGMSYDVERLGPIGLYMAIIADMVHAKNTIMDEGAGAAIQDIVYSLGHLLSNTSAVSGISDMFDALDEPSRYGAQYINGFLVSLATPYSVGVGQINRQIDPYQREVSSGNAESKTKLKGLEGVGDTFTQALYTEWKSLTKSWQSHIPGLSQRLPAKIDVFGMPIPNKEYWGVYAEHVSKDPVYQEFKSSKYFPGRVEKKILDYTLTETEYEDYARKIGVAAHLAWTRTVSIPGFKDMPEIRRHDMLQSDRRQAVSTTRAMFLSQLDHQHILIEAAKTKAGIAEGSPEPTVGQAQAIVQPELEKELDEPTPG